MLNEFFEREQKKWKKRRLRERGSWQLADKRVIRRSKKKKREESRGDCARRWVKSIMNLNGFGAKCIGIVIGLQEDHDKRITSIWTWKKKEESERDLYWLAR